jgi:hypothetical protein
MKVRDMLAKGEFNTMQQESQPDGSLLVILTKRGDKRTCRMWVTGLYTPAERVIKEEITEASANDFTTKSGLDAWRRH